VGENIKLETDRCILSKLQQIDYEDVKKLYVNEKVRKYLGGIRDEVIIKESFYRVMKPIKGSYYWVIKEKHTNEFLGLFSLDTHHDGISKEVSYQLLPQWWGAGFATEILKAIIDYAFNTLQITEIIAETQTANEASCRLLERVGMKYKQSVQRFGAEQAIYSISILK
jgi:ribosomal-protein-alanine N-acetyltransferase